MAMFVQWKEDVVLLSIAANRIETVVAVAEAAKNRRLPLVLIDREDIVADLYEAQTTPHVFVIDREGILRYRGRWMTSPFVCRKPTRFYLDEAVEALLDKRLPALAETRAYGCTIVREAVE